MLVGVTTGALSDYGCTVLLLVFDRGETISSSASLLERSQTYLDSLTYYYHCLSPVLVTEGS